MIDLSPLKNSAKKALEYAIWYPRKWYNQRKNKIRPMASCNVSMVLNCMVRSKTPVKWRDDSQMATDELMELLDSPWGWQTMKTLYPSSTAHPWNFSEILRLAAEKLQGEPVCERRYVTKTQLQKLLKTHVVGVGGKFTPSGHFITIFGIRGKDYVCDDSYGNWLTGYKDQDGEEVFYPIDKTDKAIFSEKTHPVLLFKRR